MPEVTPDLMHFIKDVAPWIVFGALMSHFTFCAVVIWEYWDAVRVFVQRDDGVSNLGRENRRSEKNNVQVSEYELES